MLDTMPAYLSDEWLARARQRLESLTVEPPVEPPLTISQTVLDGPSGAVRYSFTIDGGRVELRDTATDDDGAVRITQSYETAAAIARGELNAQWAFMHGQLRVGGDIARMIEVAGALESLGDALAELRADTTF